MDENVGLRCNVILGGDLISKQDFRKSCRFLSACACVLTNVIVVCRFTVRPFSMARCIQHRMQIATLLAMLQSSEYDVPPVDHAVQLNGGAHRLREASPTHGPLGIEPRASRMQSVCDTTTPCAA